MLTLQGKQKTALILGGKRGVIRIIMPELNNMKHAKHLIGHGAAINQLICRPLKPYLLASASADRSFRLWNIETNVCIATFHGVEAHRDEVVSIDFNRDCTQIVSGGMDHMIAIWDLKEPEIIEAIVESRKYDPAKSDRAFKTIMISFPKFINRNLHRQWIDCVKFHNKLILSKVSSRTINFTVKPIVRRNFLFQIYLKFFYFFSIGNFI